MVTFEKELTTPEGVKINYHKINKGDLSPDLDVITLFINSWYSKEVYLQNTEPISRTAIRIDLNFLVENLNIANNIIEFLTSETLFKDAIVYKNNTPEQEELQLKAIKIKQKRDQLLQESDWIVVKATEEGKPVPEEWKTYRQALRDVTSQPEYPKNIVWPQKPV